MTFYEWWEEYEKEMNKDDYPHIALSFVAWRSGQVLSIQEILKDLIEDFRVYRDYKNAMPQIVNYLEAKIKQIEEKYKIVGDHL